MYPVEPPPHEPRLPRHAVDERIPTWAWALVAAVSLALLLSVVGRCLGPAPQPAATPTPLAVVTVAASATAEATPSASATAAAETATPPVPKMPAVGGGGCSDGGC